MVRLLAYLPETLILPQIGFPAPCELAMTNSLNAKLVRITTRASGGRVPTEMPLTTPESNQFSVIVEGVAGNLLSASGQPYFLEILALDISAGANPHSESNNFT